MKTLFDKLKPHIKDKLDAQAEKYTTIEYIYDKLKNKNQYNELTIDEVKTIHTFTDLWYRDIDSLDLIYGDHLFNQTL
tara:strand:+ start:265 stop:498 length:234 start_codon:yes stop_codon:yes gene_type:complete